jgi:ribosome-associated translation inhibitor RaiA
MSVLGKHHQVIENVKEIIVRRLGKFQKKYKTETSYDITTTTYKKNTLKNIATNGTAIY